MARPISVKTALPSEEKKENEETAWNLRLALGPSNEELALNGTIFDCIGVEEIVQNKSTKG